MRFLKYILYLIVSCATFVQLNEASVFRIQMPATVLKVFYLNFNFGSLTVFIFGQEKTIIVLPTATQLLRVGVSLGRGSL